jgi:hypothetical protein
MADDLKALLNARSGTCRIRSRAPRYRRLIGSENPDVSRIAGADRRQAAAWLRLVIGCLVHRGMVQS